MFDISKEYAATAIARVKQSLAHWQREEAGAVTVDWVVITATLTVIGGIIVNMTVDGTTNVGEQVGTVLENKPVTE